MNLRVSILDFLGFSIPGVSLLAVLFYFYYSYNPDLQLSQATALPTPLAFIFVASAAYLMGHILQIPANFMFFRVVNLSDLMEDRYQSVVRANPNVNIKLKPGLLSMSFEIELENISHIQKTLDLKGFTLTDIPKKVVESGKNVNEWFRNHEIVPLHTDHENMLTLKPGESKKLELSAMVDPILDRYNVLIVAGKEDSVIMDVLNDNYPGNWCSIKIIDVQTSPNSFVNPRNKSTMFDALLGEFLVVNNTPFSWEIQTRESFKAFQRNGRELISPII